MANTISMINTHVRFNINMYRANFIRQILIAVAVYATSQIHVGLLDRCDLYVLCVCDDAYEPVQIVLRMR